MPGLTLTILSGLPGSGKSTKARELQRLYGSLVVSRDDLRRNFSYIGEDELTIRLVQLTRSFLRNGISVIVDSCNLHPQDRDRWTNLAREHEARLYWIHVNTEVEECVRRDAGRATPVGGAAIRADAAMYDQNLRRLDQGRTRNG